MKAFKKWLKEYPKTNQLCATSDVAADAWRAALEWLLTQHPCGYMRDILEKELEEK